MKVTNKKYTQNEPSFKTLRNISIMTLQEDDSESFLKIDIYRDFRNNLGLSVNVDGKKHEITPDYLDKIISEFKIFTTNENI